MKIEITYTKEVEVTMVKVDLPVRYEEEDIPNDFPLRKNDVWSAIIDIDKGIVLDWEKGKKGSLHMKVADEGSYYLLDKDGNNVESIEQDYVPNKLLPPSDGYGDYVHLDIDENGIITNWYSEPSLENFMLDEDEY